jgi:hypothetical protein
VPTNHLYLGDVLVYRQSDVRFPDLSVQQGIRIFLTGGMSLPGQLRARRSAATRPGEAGESRAS